MYKQIALDLRTIPEEKNGLMKSYLHFCQNGALFPFLVFPVHHCSKGIISLPNLQFMTLSSCVIEITVARIYNDNLLFSDRNQMYFSFQLH